MSDVPFYQTRMGRRFYESTVPQLVEQLTRLNDLLARHMDEVEGRDDSPDEEPDDDSS